MELKVKTTLIFDPLNARDYSRAKAHIDALICDGSFEETHRSMNEKGHVIVILEGEAIE